MENIAGYIRVRARAMIENEMHKPFFGKPHIKYGQCYGLWGYLFQTSGILGAKYASNLDAFGYAFLGAQGSSGAVKNFFTEKAEKLLTESVNDSMSFSDYIGTEVVRMTGHKGNAATYFLEHGMDKMQPATAEKMAWEFSSDGAALGAIFPEMIRKMYARTHSVKPYWDEAYAAGVNIPQRQDLMTYKETEDEETRSFMEYCKHCCPDVYSILA